jgi:hypothetical protein
MHLEIKVGKFAYLLAIKRKQSLSTAQQHRCNQAATEDFTNTHDGSSFDITLFSTLSSLFSRS